MRLSFVLLAAVQVCALGAPRALAPSDEPVTITLDGDRVEYSPDRKHATLVGNVRILISAPGYTAGRAVVRANRVEADLEKGIIVSDQGGTILVGPALFTGDTIRFDANREEFCVEGAEGYMELGGPGAAPEDAQPTAYFKGHRIGKIRNVVYVLRGRITTCDRDRPHYYVAAKRIKYDKLSVHVTVYGAKLHLYGVTLPAIPWGRVKIGGKEPSGKLDWRTTPGYGSREGIFLPYTFRLSPRNSSWLTVTSFRITTKRGITGSVWTKHSTRDWDYDFRASRKEWKVDDIEDRLSLYRLPEANFTRYLTPRDEEDKEVRLDLSLGKYYEDWENQPVNQPFRPRVSEGRALAAVSYTGNPVEYREHKGRWYGAVGRASRYTTDETFRELKLFAGMGGAISDNIKAYGTVSHHFTGGATPFLFDDVDIETELAAGADWEMLRNWTVDGWGRYDLDATDLRDYEVGLSYRAHCLTWRAFYRDVSDQIGLRVDLTGLTGDTKACRSESSLQRRMRQEGLFIGTPPPAGEGKLRIEGKGGSE
jgi:lipopolysaccharide assembly outer membrane protein LptD (OstA)